MECWKLQGGAFEDFPHNSDIAETENRITQGSHWAIQLFLVGLAYGAYFSLFSMLDSPNLGSGGGLLVSSDECAFVGMPAPRRNNRSGRDNRYNGPRNNRHVQNTDRYGNNVRSQTPRRDARGSAGNDRMSEVSRHLVRLPRHPPKRNEARSPVDFPSAASVSLSEVVNRPTFKRYQVTEEELLGLISRNDPRDKLRFDSYTSESGERRVSAFNGHSIPNVALPERSHAPASRFVIHGTTLEASHAIALDGFRLVGGRKGFHFTDSTYSARQFA